MRNPIFARVVAAITLFFYAYACPVMAWADSVTASAATGTATAKEALNAWSPPSASSTEITFGSDAAKQSISISELFPGVTDSSNTSALSNIYGDDKATMAAGSDANLRLTSEESSSGEAYRLLRGNVSQTRPDLTNDPLWNNTDKIIDNQALFNKEFSDCKQNTEYTKGTTTKHVSELKQCERVTDKSGSYTLKHEYLAGVVRYYDGPANVQSCGEGCVDIWLGQVGNDYWRGSCTIFENEMKFEVIKPEAIQSAQLVYAKWDDYMQVLVGGTKVWSGPNENFPPETAGACELDTSWETNPDVNMTSIVKKGGVIPFKIRASVTGRGEAYAKLRILYDPQEVISNDNWYPPEAAEAVTAVNDGACQGKFVCNKMPEVDENGCAVINGTRVCESSFKNKSPASGISPLCQEVSVDAQCNFYKGDMQCYTDAQGNEQCPTNSDKTCAVSHDMRVVEVPVSARFAVEDAPGAGETNRVEVDFLAGTYRNTSSNLRSDGYVDQASLEVMCKKGADGKRLPQRFAVSSTSIWTGHKFAPNTLTEDSLNIVQMPTCDNGLKMIVDVKDTGKGTPGAFYAHELKLKNVRIDGESFGPQYCIDSANKIQNGQCSEGGSVTVTRGVASGCLNLKGVTVCPGDDMYNAMKPSPIKGVDKLFQNVKVQGCVTGGLNLDTCTKFEADKQCGFISRQCVDGAEGESGKCYVTEETWDCGHEVEVPTSTSNTSYQCDGPVRCLGTECFSPTDEKSTDFGYAAAALQIAQFAEHDLDCGENPTDTSTDHNCKVWKGEPMECKKAVGGWVDCCEAPDGISLMDYVSLTMSTIKLTETVGIIDKAPTAEAAWTFGKELASGAGWGDAWHAAADTNTGVSTISQMIGLDVLKQKMMNYAAQWTANTFGTAAANTIFASGAASQGASSAPYATTNATTGAVSTAPNATFAAGFASALSVIMIAYTIYTIANIMVKIIWECEQKEFELAAKKETKVCHFIGSYCASKSPMGCIEKRESYCCFNSPLGRIIQEQARPQLGRTWGDAENPTCEGISVGDLAKLDWSKIDISEWIGLLQITNNYPNVNSIGLDNLTGSGSALNMPGSNRADTLTRNNEIMDKLEVTFPDARNASEKSLRGTFTDQ